LPTKTSGYLALNTSLAKRELLVNQRRKAVDAINQIKSDIQEQYNKELKESRNKINVETAGVFLESLASKDNTDPNKVRGLKNGILVHNRDTGMLMHVLLCQACPPMTALSAQGYTQFFRS